LLCEPNDAGSLADALYSLWRNPEQLGDLARQAATGVRQFHGVEQMASRAVTVYDRLLH
jgi:hypothetical protein